MASSCWWCRVAVQTAVRGRQRTPGHEHGGRGKCHAIATCVRDPAPDELPDGRRRSSSTAGGVPTSGSVQSIPAGRTKTTAKKILPRDHAPAQLQEPLVVVSKMWHAHGAHVPPRHARLGPLRPGVVWPDVGPLASDVVGAGIGDPGSNAGSNAAAGTFVHSPCADKCADAVGGGTSDYDDGNPRERYLPRDSPGRTRKRSPRALLHTGKRTVSGKYTSRNEPDSEGNCLRKARPRKR